MVKEKFIRLREAHNLSRKEFATILNCNIKHVVDIEKGIIGISGEDSGILQDYFDLPPGYFGPHRETPETDEGDYDDIIGRNVKFFRKKHNMTQKMFAEEIGFANASSISAIERGIKPIGKKKLIKIAKLFDVHVSELFSPYDLSQTGSEAKLINDFIFLVRSEKKPSVYDAIKQLVEAGCNELKKL